MPEQKPQSPKEKRVRSITHLYYSKPEIQKALFDFSKNREVVPRYFEGFGKRPDMFQYPNDMFELVKRGATSFHCSQELWKNPLEIETGMPAEKLNSLREGWDLLLDIDSKYLDYSKILALQILKVLKFYGVKNIGLKFSGSRGFHMIIPSKAFPEEINGVKTSDMFPEWPRILTNFIINATKKELVQKISDLTKPNKYVRDFKAPKEVMPDLILVSPRHLFRMPYSVDFDEPIYLKRGGKIQLTKIGDFVDQFFTKGEHIQSEDIKKSGYETASLDIQNNKARFSKITKVIRHKISEDLFSVNLESGRKVKVTSGHSMFVLKNGKIEIIKGSKIRKGDYIVALGRIPEIRNSKNWINLADEIIEIKGVEKKKIFLFDFDKSIYSKIYSLKIPDRDKTQFYNWKQNNIIPLDAYEILVGKSPLLKKYFKDSKIKMSRHGGAKEGIKNILKINKDFMRMLGYYVSEGYCDINRPRLNFSFGSHEKELIKDCIKILKSLGLHPRLRKPHATAVQIEVNSSIFHFILSSLFKCGNIALKKRVPSVVWGVNRKLKKEFLRGYINGDGHIEKVWAKIVMSTASKRLQEDICFLLTSLGCGYSLNKTFPSKWNKTNKEQYIIIIQGKKELENLGFESKSKRVKEPLSKRFPIKELGLEKYILSSRWKNQYINKKVIERNKDFIKKLNPSEEVLKLIRGDVSFFKVRDIRKVKPTSKYVYDLSVNEDENFVGGDCILLHNSLHEKTALASVVLTPEELENFQPREANPMTAKIKEFLPNVKKGEATELLREALDWHKNQAPEEEKNFEKKKSEFRPVQISDFSEKNFPPAIQTILKGVNDGRKRSVFILLNFLRSIGMDRKDVEKKLHDWNKRNPVPLQEGYITSQLAWSYRNKIVPPPNYDKDYYKGVGAIPTEEEMRYKNPVSFMAKKFSKKEKPKKKAKK